MLATAPSIHGARAVGTSPARANSRVKLNLLNTFQLTRDEAEVSLPSGLQHLLAYLALHRRAHRRSHVAAALWEDVTDRRAAGNLRSALWRLRRHDLDIVGTTNQHVGLSDAVFVDVYEAERLAKRIIAPSNELEMLGLEDLPIVGELLPGWADDWVLLERERLRQVALHVLDALCERWCRQGRYRDAVLAGLAAVRSEPLRETSQKALIAAHIAEGNPTEAIRQFARYRDTLWRELRLEPSDDVDRMVRGLRGVTGG
jgi:DNA-binding SARP family transcriptional activator